MVPEKANIKRQGGNCQAEENVHGMWKCIGCGFAKSKKEYSKWLAPNPKRKKDRYTRCNPSISDAEEEKEQTLKECLRQVVR